MSNEPQNISIHMSLGCLFSSSGWHRRKRQISESLAFWEGSPPVVGRFSSWSTNNVESVSTLTRHHGLSTHWNRDTMAANFQTTFLHAFSWITRQIWGIWKLRPAYSPETPNLGQNRWCFVPCDLEIWWITLENNRASHLCCFKLCATFHSHRWIQAGVTVRKCPIWVKIDDF